MRKYVSVFALVGAGIIAALVFGPFGLGIDMECSNRIVRELPAPDGKRMAVLFERNCGATTGFSMQVSVLPPGARPAEGGNVFVADDNHGAAPKRDGSYVALRWLSATDLLIAYESHARTYKKADSVDGVNVIYNSAPDDLKPL